MHTYLWAKSPKWRPILNYFVTLGP